MMLECRGSHIIPVEGKPVPTFFLYPTIWEFQIRDVLIRIRIRVSVPLKYGSRSGFCSSFLHWLSRCQSKISFLKAFFCLLLTLGKFTSAQTVAILIFYLLMVWFGSERLKNVRICWKENDPRWLWFFCTSFLPSWPKTEWQVKR